MVQDMEKRIRAIIHEEVENVLNDNNNNGNNIENLKAFTNGYNSGKQEKELQISLPLRPTTLMDTDHNISHVPRSRSISPKKRPFKDVNYQGNGIGSSKIPRLSN